MTLWDKVDGFLKVEGRGWDWLSSSTGLTEEALRQALEGKDVPFSLVERIAFLLEIQPCDLIGNDEDEARVLARVKQSFSPSLNREAFYLIYPFGASFLCWSIGTLLIYFFAALQGGWDEVSVEVGIGFGIALLIFPIVTAAIFLLCLFRRGEDFEAVVRQKAIDWRPGKGKKRSSFLWETLDFALEGKRIFVLFSFRNRFLFLPKGDLSPALLDLLREAIRKRTLFFAGKGSIPFGQFSSQASFRASKARTFYSRLRFFLCIAFGASMTGAGKMFFFTYANEGIHGLGYAFLPAAVLALASSIASIVRWQKESDERGKASLFIAVAGIAVLVGVGAFLLV